jgi:hypothetical protein
MVDVMVGGQCYTALRGGDIHFTISWSHGLLFPSGKQGDNPSSAAPITAMASHSLLRAFESNTPAFGVWVTLPGTFHARTVALASPHLSWITIDCEHGLIPLIPDAAATVSAVENVRKSPGDVPISTLVRIPATGVSNSSSWQIKYALDAGARGVVVPLVCILFLQWISIYVVYADFDGS